MNKPTIGSIVQDLSLKTPESQDPIEIQRQLQKDYMKNLLEAVDRGYKRFLGDFYIHVEKKAEPLLERTFRHYFIDKQDCPTPNYDQDIYRYSRIKGEIEYLWSVPDRETCFHLMANKHLVVPEEQWLLSFVIKYDNGELYKLCKELNGEI
jgi:hypothetical protein